MLSIKEMSICDFSVGLNTQPKSKPISLISFCMGEYPKVSIKKPKFSLAEIFKHSE